MTRSLVLSGGGVTDLLGHDERSYDSAAHRELTVRAARWLTGAI